MKDESAVQVRKSSFQSLGLNQPARMDRALYFCLWAIFCTVRTTLLVSSSLVTVSMVGAAEAESVLRSECEAFISRAIEKLPRGWRVAERSFGLQQIANRWGGQPTGLRVRLEGPQIWRPYSYRGPALTPAEHRAHFRRRPESICLWVIPRSYRLKKDMLLADWFRPDAEQTHRLSSTGRLDLYGYGERSLSWTTWRTEIQRNLRK